MPVFGEAVELYGLELRDDSLCLTSVRQWVTGLFWLKIASRPQVVG